MRGLGLLLLLFGLLGTGACKPEAKPAPKNTAPASTGPAIIRLNEAGMQAAGLQVEPVQPRSYKRSLRVPGVVKPNPNHLVDVSSLIPGRAFEVLVNIGDRAQPRQVLARVDSTELGLAQSDYLKSQAHLGVAEKGLDRAAQLLEAKVIGTGEFQRREGDTLVARANHRAAKEHLVLLGMTEQEISHLARTQQINSRASIRSPLEGTVIERHINLGEIIDPRTKLFVVADLRRLWVMADVHEKDIPKVQLGLPVEIQVTPYPDQIFNGVVVHIGEIIEEATRTVKVRTEVPNPDGRLKPEMFATMMIMTTTEDHVLAVPTMAVQKDRGRDIVFVQTDTAHFEPREVTLGEPSGDYVPVLKGLVQGDQIVTQGSFILKSEMNKQDMEPA